MAYSNTAGYGASAHPASTNYIFANSGDPVATAEYFSNSELPGYTVRFYSLSQHEQFSEFNYDKIMIDYNKELKQIRDSFQGLPIEAYIPHTTGFDSGSAAAPKQKEQLSVDEKQEIIIPSKRDIIDEIKEAQLKAIKGEFIIETVEEEILIRKKRSRLSIRKNVSKN